ncbi:hypothetical protein [Absidia glauca]|uniref:Uncharacterized protein n=1 Tax=Absidia glauca TaxID=4829 RepID=A0A168NQB9_ABSGL|nr:hypothetical protein [Absidia glauca]
MNSQQFTPRNSLRFSLASCATEDSVDSAGISTPLDVSPCPQRNVNFPIFNPADQDSPYLTRFQIPDVAAVVGRHRHRNQDTISPAPRSIRIIQTQDLSPPPSTQTQTPERSLHEPINLIQPQQQEQQPLQQNHLETSDRQSNYAANEQHYQQIQSDGHGRFTWPRIKRILSNSSLSSSSSTANSSDSHRHHIRKKPTSSRGVMTHLSTLVHNSMRLSNSIAATDLQHLDRTDFSANTSSESTSDPKTSTAPAARGWFGKSKSRVAPQHCHIP